MEQLRLVEIDDAEKLKRHILNQFKQVSFACHLTSNGYTKDKYGAFDAAYAWGAEHSLVLSEEKGAFEQLQWFQKKHPNQWIFGCLSYDLKNDLEQLKSENPHWLESPALVFFIPKYLIIEKNQQFWVSNAVDLNKLIAQESNTVLSNNATKAPKLIPSTSKDLYLQNVQDIKQHIIEGDIYEMNYCVEFTVKPVQANPIHLFKDLNERGKAPFSCYFNFENIHLLSVSPERYLAKRQSKLISQPIKGTAARYKDRSEDNAAADKLFRSEKDRAENVMIVDLVRNDLARVSETGTIQVEELFGIYPFKTVHQMISTVSGQLKATHTGLDAIKASFPMGSMTGAPKHRSMILIDKYENRKRGFYSGAIGYFTPQGDFDFNVVIRTLIIDQEKEQASFSVGGAIVYDSIPELEYEECLIKARALLEALGLPINLEGES